MPVTLNLDPLPFKPVPARTIPAHGEQVSNSSIPNPSVVAKDFPPTPGLGVETIPTSPPPEPQEAELANALTQLRQAIELKAPNELEFTVDKETGRTIIRIVDSKTGDVLRQIPPRELIEIAKSIDRMQGLLVHQEA